MGEGARAYVSYVNTVKKTALVHIVRRYHSQRTKLIQRNINASVAPRHMCVPLQRNRFTRLGTYL